MTGANSSEASWQPAQSSPGLRLTKHVVSGPQVETAAPTPTAPWITLGTALLLVLAGCTSAAPKGEQSAAAGAAVDSAAIAQAHAQWIRAFQQHDTALIEPLLAEEIVYHGDEPFTKQHLLRHVRDTSFALESVSPTELRVRVVGSARDVAIVTGSVKAKGRRVGQTFNLQNRYTEVWVKRGGRWQCVAGQEVTWPVKAR